VTDPGPPPPPPEPSRPRVPPWGSPSWAGGADNPRTYPQRAHALVDADVRAAARQRDELMVEMGRTGQADALVVADLVAVPIARSTACTATVWAQGRITVLPVADVVELFALPTSVEGTPTSLRVRWDVVERVCRACWQPVPGLVPPRMITRRWPDASELEVLAGLRLPDQPPAGG